MIVKNNIMTNIFIRNEKIKKILETKYTCKCLYSIKYIFIFVFVVFINAK